VPGKRQHYVPRFLLRRFAIDPTDKRSLVFRLDKKTGQPRRVNPANEVVVGHYYRIVGEDGTVDDTADEVLDRIETMAAEVIAKLADPAYTVTGDDVQRLVLFIVTLKNRTPQGREALRETDERAGELWLEMLLSDREHFHHVMRKHGGTEEDIEAERLKALDELKSGRIVMESSPEREVALMFGAVENTAKTVFEKLACVCLRAPADGKSLFVVSDHPVSHYDPTPKTPEAGASFMSSPNSLTCVPLDPRFALLLVQDRPPQTWVDVEATPNDVDQTNLLTYAWARDAIYGPTQETVTRVRRLAKQNPRLMGEFAYRPPRIWVTEDEDDDGRAGPRQFTSRFKGKTATRTLHVTQEGLDEARRSAWSPSDDGPESVDP
jgi:hypothetical protein